LEDADQSRLKAEAVVETLRRLGGVDWSGKVEVITGEAWGYRLRSQLRVQPAAESGVAEDAVAEDDVAEDDVAESGMAEDEVEPIGDSEADQEAAPLGLPRVGYFRRGSRTLVPVEQCPVLVPELEAMLRDLPEALLPTIAERPLPERIDMAAGDSGSVTLAPPLPGLPSGELSLQVGENIYAFDAGCFFQAHSGLLARLVEVAVGDYEGEAAYDLYCGVGLFTLPLARRYPRVVAVEGDRSAARYARINARRNRLKGVEIEARAVETWLEELPRRADRVLVDPPRSGLTLPVRAALLRCRPRRLTYVSCHSATLARDLKAMGHFFEIESITLLDLFPQTGHMETVVQMTSVDP
jgi:23S rRNA (uracil1939-C5)-methyltransferase